MHIQTGVAQQGVGFFAVGTLQPHHQRNMRLFCAGRPSGCPSAILSVWVMPPKILISTPRTRGFGQENVDGFAGVFRRGPCCRSQENSRVSPPKYWIASIVGHRQGRPPTTRQPISPSSDT